MALNITPPSISRPLPFGSLAKDIIEICVDENDLGLRPLLDIVFALDATDSMQQGLAAVRELCKLVAHALLADPGLDCRVSVVRFQDYLLLSQGGSNSFVTDRSIIGLADHATFAGRVDALDLGPHPALGHPNDAPEAHLEAFAEAIAMKRAGAGLVIVCLSDIMWRPRIPANLRNSVGDLTETVVESMLTRVGAKLFTVDVTTATGLGMNADASHLAVDYAVGEGSAGQATRLADRHFDAIDASNVSTTVSALVAEIRSTSLPPPPPPASTIGLMPRGAIHPFIRSLTPALPISAGVRNGQGQLCFEFEVDWEGVRPCLSGRQQLSGAFDIKLDQSDVGDVDVEILVPACSPLRYTYCVKFVCGVQACRDEQVLDAADHDPQTCCHCPTVPGCYATEINIHNPHDVPADILKRVVTVHRLGEPIGREPRTQGPDKLVDSLKLPPHHATMDDCCRIYEMMRLPPSTPRPLTIGFLEIRSPVELCVTAVYTATGKNGDVSIDVERVVPHQRHAPLAPAPV